MKIRQIRLLLGALSVLLYCGISAQAAPSKSALLIGIDTYKHPNLNVPPGAPPAGRYEQPFTPLRFYNLQGPSHDVAAMRTLLTSEKFGFPDDGQHIHILLNQQATHDAMLQAMQQYLVRDPNPGDTVVLYFSGHGSLRADPKGHGQLYDLDGTGRNLTYVENTIVPYDWYLGSDDIFSRDLRHIFNQAADRNIHVTAIFDACYSGSIARGLANPALVARDFLPDFRPMPDDPYPAEAKGIPPESRAGNPVLVLSAAQKEQSATDVATTLPPHGLFTNALIETLQALPADRPSADVFKRLEVAMELTPDVTPQQPALDASVTRREQPLFGGSAGSGPPTAAIVSADAAGVVLDIGHAADIGPGSEFTQLIGSNGVRAVLKVTEPLGVARSKATVISPVGATVHAKDLVQLTKWVPAERPTLLFYTGASNPSAAEIQDALAVVRTAHLNFAADPSRDPWTHHLAWDGKHWTLSTHSQKQPGGQSKLEKPIVLGAKLSPSALGKLPPASVVWFDAPLPRESASALLPAPGSAAELTPDRGKAIYVIAGTLTEAGISYAWFHRADVDAELQTPKGFGAGCAPASAYPLRTDWVAPSKEQPPELALLSFAVQLARLNGWLKLASAALNGQADFPYRLALRSDAENQDVIDGGKTYNHGAYRLMLVSSMKGAASTGSRWVYVLSIDCQGKGELIWPYGTFPDTKFPTEKVNGRRIPLPGDPVPVEDPLGTDTYLLLTTSTPLSTRDALQFLGVATRDAPARAMNPLEDLLYSTSEGTRTLPGPAPPNWSVQMLKTQSLPQSAPTAANGK